MPKFEISRIVEAKDRDHALENLAEEIDRKRDLHDVFGYVKNLDENENARSQAGAQFESIKEIFERYDASKNDKEQDGIMQELDETPLSVEVEKHYIILLCTGGPAVRVTGTLDEHNQAETATLQYQDWGTPWTDYPLKSGAEDDLLLRYAQTYYMGE